MDPAEYDNVARQEGVHWWYTGMAGMAATFLRRISLPSAARILDAGCGTGGGLRWLAEFGRPYGVDLHPAAVGRAGTGGAGRVVCGDVRALPFRDSSFDLLTSFEVLSQVPASTDCSALLEFARVLRPGGWLLLRLPAHDWLRGAHDSFVHTRHRYTRGEVREKLLAGGLRPVRLTYANCLLFLPALVWRIARRDSGAASDVRPMPAAVNRLLATLLRWEAEWLSRFDLPMGLSVLALARKGPS